MVIDLEKIKKLEKKYQNDGIALSALHNMVQLVSQADSEILGSSLAFSTLVDLGVISSSEKRETQQLNS